MIFTCTVILASIYTTTFEQLFPLLTWNVLHTFYDIWSVKETDTAFGHNFDLLGALGHQQFIQIRGKFYQFSVLIQNGAYLSIYILSCFAKGVFDQHGLSLRPLDKIILKHTGLSFEETLHTRYILMTSEDHQLATSVDFVKT